jgi:hypothetical protein
VLKANGHSDSEFVRYLTTKETKKVLKLGFGAAGAALPSFLLDGEFRSLVMKTRKQLKSQKQKAEDEQIQTQQKLMEVPKNVAKIGPVLVSANSAVFESGNTEGDNTETPAR